MDELGKARGRKFAAQIENAGWVLDAGQEDETSSGGFWLYSYSIPQGSRLVAQLTPEGYRAMCSGEMLKHAAGLSPVGVLGGALAHYDALCPERRDRTSSRDLALALALYASHTQTLKALPKLQGGLSLHFMVFDWHTAQGARILKPGAAGNPSPITPAELERFSARVLFEHLINNPSERPA
ncbi:MULTISPECIES: hypothetical protein [Pseudomonadaceae]|uniref:Uncharacterized protein n=1 Tax=Stutzerimonas stutzeri TaxID=316 RepID=A0AA40RV33_STUST|nr:MULTISPECIES: hypothetical protein [Pseudomonadaceae]MBA1265041.1 hypothetical protein [Stutzerimonas stutzeri]MBA1306054.1 hypothetical protein [Stutzerimonas stutzeri]MBO8344068.1 hypothetical protein [Pseudomonas aeruginosa]MBS9726797.1 hypothetical protein [Stutzerimonas stutzeri]QYG43609.1 hypothetical protein J5V74_30255 [Pseudomonas aeruginosa]